MDNVKEFILWFLNNLPAFLMSEPIKYFVGFAFLIITIYTVKMIRRI